MRVSAADVFEAMKRAKCYALILYDGELTKIFAYGDTDENYELAEDFVARLNKVMLSAGIISDG